MNKNILLCGVGGQGTVLASKLLAAAAMKKGLCVMSAETIGMAQRGGSVFSHLKIGENLYTPMLGSGTADLILGFEPAEAVRMLPYLKKDGWVIVSSKPIKPVSASLSNTYDETAILEYLHQNVKNLVLVDTEKACGDLGSQKVLNMLLFGAALDAGVLSITKDEIISVMEEKINPKFHSLNRRALLYFNENEVKK